MGSSKAVTNCTTKRRYEKEVDALKTQMYLWQEKGIDMSIYHCNICEGWHLTRGDSDEA